MGRGSKRRRDLYLPRSWIAYGIAGVIPVIVALAWIYYDAQWPSTEGGIERLAYRLSVINAVDCGSNIDYKDFAYPSKADECAAKALKEGKPFRVHGCYARTDTAGCYWMVTTSSNGQIYFLSYTSYALGNQVGDLMVAPCTPQIVIKHKIEAVQCLSLPLDSFHIDY